MTRTGLTDPQKRVMRYVQRRIDETGVAPSREEIMHALGLSSRSFSQRLLDQLIERGYLAKIPNRRRALIILERLPNDQSALTAYRAALETIANRARRPSEIAARVLKEFP